MAIWEDIKRKTNELVADNDRIKDLVKQASEKLSEITKDEDSKTTLSSNVKLLIRMVKSSISGNYNGFSYKTVFLMLFALVYFVVPTDLLPDFVPLLGFSDDLAVLYYVIGSVSDDIVAYKEWEELA
jgi:uncharacterized membrane protein YkvA (DUF1232 family)